jgi:hypothetical protein
MPVEAERRRVAEMSAAARIGGPGAYRMVPVCGMLFRSLIGTQLFFRR